MEICSNVNTVEISKSLKAKGGKSTPVLEENYSITNLKGKLFVYFKIFVDNININCPEKGIRCSINKIKKTFCLSTVPSYLTFNLTYPVGCQTHLSRLKSFILIPKIFELSSVFSYPGKNNKFYEFTGAICENSNKYYTCFFKDNETNVWLHFKDEIVTRLEDRNALISFCIKNGDTPILVFFAEQDKYVSAGDKELSQEEIERLERYCRNLDSLHVINENRFRPLEDVTKPDTSCISEGLINANENKYKKNTHSTGDNNTEKNNDTSSTTTLSHQNSSSLKRYDCVYCGCKNRIEDYICVKCRKNNEQQVNEIRRKNSDDKTKTAAFNNGPIAQPSSLHRSSSKGNIKIEEKSNSLRNQPETQSSMVRSNTSKISKSSKIESNSRISHVENEGNLSIHIK